MREGGGVSATRWRRECGYEVRRGAFGVSRRPRVAANAVYRLPRRAAFFRHRLRRACSRFRARRVSLRSAASLAALRAAGFAAAARRGPQEWAAGRVGYHN
jgi:hypothetical protein